MLSNPPMSYGPDLGAASADPVETENYEALLNLGKDAQHMILARRLDNLLGKFPVCVFFLLLTGFKIIKIIIIIFGYFFQPNAWVKPNLEDWRVRRSINCRRIDFLARSKKVARALASFACANSKLVRRFAFSPVATNITPNASTNGSR